MTTNQLVLYEVRDQVATITLNRPEVLNAVNDAMVDTLTQAFARAAADANVRTVILTGAGRAFAAGADMKELAANHTPEKITELIAGHYKPLLLAIATCPKTVIAAIRGPAAGMAASLALACDLRIMSEDAYLLLAFTNIGLMAAAGSTWFLTHLVGYSRAFEIASEGERIPASAMFELGVVQCSGAQRCAGGRGPCARHQTRHPPHPGHWPHQAGDAACVCQLAGRTDCAGGELATANSGRARPRRGRAGVF